MNNIPEKYLLLFFALLFSGSAFSQSPDTIVVYEYIYKTDTVWLDSRPNRDTIELHQLQNIEEATLFIDSISKKAELVLFSSGACATIPIKNIILSDNQQNLIGMKKIAFLGLTLLALNSTTNAQNEFNDRLGFYIKGNAATQEYKKFDDLDKFYTAEENRLTLGFGVKYEHNLNKTFSVVGNFGYLQRGCYQPSYAYTYFYQDRSSEEKTITEKVNRFYNLTLDALLKMSFRKNRVFNPYLYTGIRGDYTLKKTIEYPIDDGYSHYFDGSPYWVNSGYYGFKTFNYGVIAGFGLDFNKRILLELEINRDLSFLLKNDILRAKNFMLSINLGFYLDKIPHYKAVKKKQIANQ